MTPVQPQLFPPAQTHMVDLFAGPGGLDVAAHWLGVAATGIEWDDDACETRKKAGLETRHKDVRIFGPKDFPDATVLAGGPPCQTYTVAGRGAGRRALDQVLQFLQRMANGENVTEEADKLHGNNDERTGLVLQPMRWILEAHRNEKPYEVVVLEQVPAVLPVWDAYAKVLQGLDYNVACGILHTEEFGVPQTRRRAILIARREGEAALPKPTHRRYRKGKAQSEGEDGLLPWVSMAQVLPSRGKFVVVSNYGTGGDPKDRGKRRSDEPSATVTGKISRNRLYRSETLKAELPRLEPHEYGRLQTFPINYPWSGKQIAQQVGNAIPPRLAAHVLAAALGMKFTTENLDKAVDATWDYDPYGEPLLPTTSA